MPLKHNLMTTLHGLVTISELFASFNLINRGVVNCLIMHQNARKMHHSEAKIQTFFWGGAQPFPQTPPTLRGGHRSANPTPSAPAVPRPRYSRLGPQTKVLNPPVRGVVVVIFSAGVTELYYRSDGSKIWGEVVHQGVWDEVPQKLKRFH